MDTQELSAAQDPKMDAMHAVFEEWSKAFPATRVTASEVIARATELEPVGNRMELKNRPLFEALSTVAGSGGTLNANRLGRWLRAHAGRITDGCCIIQDGERHKVAVWRMDFEAGR